MKIRSFVSWIVACLFATLCFAQGYKPAAGERVMVVAIEGRGDIYIRLHQKEAPKTTSRIVELIRKGFYNGQSFYRVIRSPRPYLVQMGAPSSKELDADDPRLLKEGTGKAIAFEDSGFTNNAEGVVGLSAQPGDRDSGDCQFYILLAPAKFLDGNYTVFGKVVQGLDVLRKIEKGDKVKSIKVLDGE